METGEAAPTWLDTHLDADERWADGVPTDAPAWVADAFEELETITDAELTAVVVPVDEPSEHGAAAVVRDEIDVGEWLVAAGGEVVADDVAFEVDVPTSLVDPFDAIVDGDADNADNEPLQSVDVGLADDIVTSPSVTSEVVVDQHVDPLPIDVDLDSEDDLAGGPDAATPDTTELVDAFDLDDVASFPLDEAALDQLPDAVVDDDDDDDDDEWNDDPAEWADD